MQSQLMQAQLAPATLGTQVSVAVAAKALDAQRQQGAAVLELLNNAGAIDSGSVAPATTGQTLDIQA